MTRLKEERDRRVSKENGKNEKLVVLEVVDALVFGRSLAGVEHVNHADHVTEMLSAYVRADIGRLLGRVFAVRATESWQLTALEL